MVSTRIHYQLQDGKILCLNNHRFSNAVTNDVDSVTCPFCTNLIKELGGEEVMDDKLKLKEILNKKQLNYDDLEENLNYLECGYGDDYL